MVGDTAFDILAAKMLEYKVGVTGAKPKEQILKIADHIIDDMMELNILE